MEGVSRKMRGAQVIPHFPKPALPRTQKDIVIVAKDFQLEIRNGDIYGLLGANGEGKTTAIKSTCGLIHPAATCAHGSVTISCP